jgi:hypothetical protein
MSKFKLFLILGLIGGEAIALMVLLLTVGRNIGQFFFLAEALPKVSSTAMSPML